ncbi:hypothetical protein AAFF_G00095570 [Aldrovandia affinis]|uniref:Uncharacterized protein n=1 Tax=Aldrovandia affinis TaxID=143900 RepID=A0AAD7RVV9_9TELE|nr:hypothetical protein AAFF_G00095570 [Aldrovandia affinis]
MERQHALYAILGKGWGVSDQGLPSQSCDLSLPPRRVKLLSRLRRAIFNCLFGRGGLPVLKARRSRVIASAGVAVECAGVKPAGFYKPRGPEKADGAQERTERGC